MENKKFIKGIALSFILFLLLSCSVRQKRMLPPERAIADSVLLSRIDSIYTHPTKMRNLFRETQKQVTDSIGYYRLELFIGFSLFLDGYPDSVPPIHRRVLDFCKKTSGTEALEAMHWNHRAVILQFESRMDSALQCLHHAYEAVRRSDDHRELTSVCINIADMYNLNGNLPQAALFYRKALSAADSLNMQREHLCIYTGLAQTYSNLFNFPMANHYFDLAKASYDDGLIQEQILFHNNKGNSLYLQEKYAEALECFKTANELSDKFKYDYFKVSIEINLGELYTLLNQTDSAHYYLDKASRSLAQTAPNQDQLFYLNSLYAGLALKENNLAAAKHYLSQPYTTDRAASIYLHNKRLMEYYVQKHDFKQAYHYREMVDKYDDSLRNIRHINNIAEIDYRYRQDTTLLKRDIIIANNKNQLSQQKGIIILSTASFIISVLLAFTIILHIRRKNERKYNRQMAMVAELRMENIRNRISPHYVFNVLNAIMPTFKQYSELAHPLQLLIEVLRGNLIVSDKIAVELGEEIELVKKYITLRQETNPHTANVCWEIDKDISLHTLIPSMIIQIPVENALKYAFDTLESEDARVSISISQAPEGLSIRIEDNGSGYHPGMHAESKRGTGNGLKVLFRTIELLNRKNEQKATFNIQNIQSDDSSRHGTLVRIYIPFNYQIKF